MEEATKKNVSLVLLVPFAVGMWLAILGVWHLNAIQKSGLYWAGGIVVLLLSKLRRREWWFWAGLFLIIVAQIMFFFSTRPSL